MMIIPAIDLRDGQCVRLYQGDFDQQTNYSKDPLTLAKDYEAMGLGELHIVDLDGARSGHQQNQEIVRSIVAATDLTIQLGGGIRNESDLEAWLASGVTRAVIGSLAVTQADMVKGWLEKYGPDPIVLALDVTIGADGMPRVATHGWTRPSEKTLWQCIDEYLPAGLRHVLCTDISRDGAMTGPSVELYAQIVKRYPDILLQASGGVRNIGDIEALGHIGAHSGICGRALLDGKITAAEIKSFLLAA